MPRRRGELLRRGSGRGRRLRPQAIVHDWEDAEAVAILRRCRSAVPPHGLLLVVERDLGGPNERPEAKLADLNMLVAPGGRERSRDEYAALFAAGGFELVGVTPSESGLQVIEGVPT